MTCGISGAAVSVWKRGFPSPLAHAIGRAMPNKPALSAFLIAVHQTDGTDNVYAIMATTVTVALELATAQEPSGAPRYVGTLGTKSAIRMKLKPGEARMI